MSLDTQLHAHAAVAGPIAEFTTPDGRSEPLTATAEQDIRQVIVQRAAEEAARAGIPVELVTSGDLGDHRILVAADGSLAKPATAAEHATPTPDREEVNEKAPERPGSPAVPEPHPRASFITPNAEAQPRVGFLARLGLGRQSRAELERAENERAVSQQWAGCRTVAVVNGKGGVGKTMTTAMISAVFARHGGGNVLAWDNNDTRGTLGWRTEPGLYDSTIRDLLPAAEDLLSPTASISDIARFVHHQPTDRYDVLRSNPELLATDQRITTADFDLLMQVATRYYRIVVFDSGNDESADRWLRMIDSSSQLVIPTVTAPESAESAALLLDALRQRDDRSRSLADNAVVVVTEAETRGMAAAHRIIDGFAGQVRAVERIPFDPALKSGPLRLDDLRAPTRDAWIRVVAAIARGL
ncbi:MinD/ParA family ATP-binding protein [Microbacterium sp. ASV49]|uniref:AAA family ATPase n=1 Tax=Microbacterium candidum TaxID=3041922 RepID=A0ABT7MVZ8_9MICO|nr:AAA family ATPase [Microbacterium sp. ASV49]MDL9978618.1 AAA family ATPase [Microbacterium sp. ASV49]